jgi:hypothetical protein
MVAKVCVLVANAKSLTGREVASLRSGDGTQVAAQDGSWNARAHNLILSSS